MEQTDDCRRKNLRNGGYSLIHNHVLTRLEGIRFVPALYIVKTNFLFVGTVINEKQFKRTITRR